MNLEASRLLVGGLLYLLIVVTGLRLRRAGRPLNTALFNLHKLVALGTVIAGGAYIRPRFGTLEAGADAAYALLAGAGLFALALFVSGALLSIKESAPPAALAVHKAATLLGLASAAGMVYLLASGGF
jgi:hypothetical protein